MPAWESISPEALAQLREKHPVHLVDVRTPDEFRRTRIDGAINIPLEQLDPATLPNDGQPVYVICRRGTRSEEACAKLVAAGREKIVHVSGGVFAWYDAGLPVVYQPKKGRFFTRRRLVYIVLLAGSISMASVVHRGFLGITGYTAAFIVLVGTLDKKKLRIFRKAAEDATPTR